jgi:hypothetical protein
MTTVGAHWLLPPRQHVVFATPSALSNVAHDSPHGLLCRGLRVTLASEIGLWSKDESRTPQKLTTGDSC